MSNPASSLPERWIQSLWTELRANYGARWDRQFPAPLCPPDADQVAHALAHVQAIQGVWAKRLGRFQSNPNAIRFALDNLPKDPPTLPEFEALCNRRPDAPQKALPAPEADMDQAQRILQGALEHARFPGGLIDRLAPLRQLREWDENNNGHMPNGKRITAGQRHVYRAALKTNRSTTDETV